MLRKFLYFLISLTVLVYTTDLFIYPGFLENKIGAPITYAFIPSIIGLFYYRFVTRKTFPDRLLNVLIYIIPAVVSACAIIQILHPVVHANFFFSTLHLHPPQLEIIALYLSLISVLLFDLDYIKKNKKIALFVFPFWFLSLSVYFKWNFPSQFWYIEKEDSVTEYLTFAAYLAVAFVAYKIVRQIMGYKILPKLSRQFLKTIFIVITLASIVIAGEEISWGQRIIGFETPESVAENNTQFEFNVHNQEGIFQYVYIAYGLLGFYGATSWAIVKALQSAKLPKAAVQTLEMLSPSWRFIGFFIPIIVYAILRENLGDVRFDQWEELMEFYLAVGILFFVYNKYSQIKSKA